MNLESCAADFSLLPAHIITQILQYLKLDDFKNASTVCKSWHYASTDPQIVRTLIIQPTERNFSEICKSNRRYGVLKLQFLQFDNIDNQYFELFEKFGPFVYELHITESVLKIHHLLKLFELTTCLEVFSFSGCAQLTQLPDLFPLNYNGDAKIQILKNLSGVKKIVVDHFRNIPLLADLVRCTTNLDSFKFNNELLECDRRNGGSYSQFFTIFDNDHIGYLRDLNLHLNFSCCADDFITCFVKIKNLNLRSFRIAIWWISEGGVKLNPWNSCTLFRQFILKLQSLVEFNIFGLSQDQLSLICQHLVNLKSLDCLLDKVQVISDLAKLKELEKLCCRFSQDTNISLVEIDTFFKHKFEYLRLFNFEEFVTERMLVHFCQNHPNLIELKLTRLLTRNLKIIFKYLTKLRVVTIYFGFASLLARPDIRVSLEDESEFESDREYEYKISRLQDLEEFHLAELVHGICEEDLRQLKKLRLTNLPRLFGRKDKFSVNI